MNIMRFKIAYLVLSGLILIPGIISLFMFRLNLAIDFTGGSVLEYKLKNDDAKKDEVLAIFKKVFEEKKVKLEKIDFVNGVVSLKGSEVTTAVGAEIKTNLTNTFPQIEQQSFETVGPSIGAESTKKALSAVAFASIGILFYIAFAFRNIPKPYSSFRFGVSAIIAMLHDAFVVLGVFSILGHFLGVQIDTLFITAILTVIGFSVHDTIVVFDRIRENLKKLPNSWGFEEVVNFSVVETLNRSVATSLTVLITLLSLYLLGGETINHFVLALLIGVFSGTYSSIFTAAPILVLWEGFRNKKR